MLSSGTNNNFGLDLAVIGNGRTAALLEPASRLVWWCYPRFDGDPVFCRLLAGDEEKGFSDVVLDGMVDFSSDYERNTAVVSTVLTNDENASIRITDFAPRFRNYDRIFRPPQLIRIIEPISGLPRITIRVRPTSSYGHPITERSLGSNHISFRGKDLVLRLTTDAPLAYIDREAPFVLTKPIHMVLGPDEPFVTDMGTTCREFADRTRDYWRTWVRRLSIAYDWQEAIIRAAIALKLSNFEETGGIVAALTTSIPEAPGSGRTWDYRYCWLRDAYFVVKALNRLGATQTMENFISFILGIASEPSIRPVYSVVPSDAMDETIAENLERLSQRRPGPRRQRRRHANAARHLWQHHPCRNAHVLRPEIAAARGQGTFRPVGDAWRQGGGARLHARRRHLGISRPHPHAHLFRGNVLGRVQQVGGDCVTSRSLRSSRSLDRSLGRHSTPIA